MAENNVPRYACPACGYKGITQGLPKCPQCGKVFNWGAPASNNAEERKDKTKNYLLNGYYWWKMLAMFCPIAGWILLFLNRDYKNNLNRQKSQTFDRFIKNVITYTALWGVLIVILIVGASMAMKKAQEGA